MIEGAVKYLELSKILQADNVFPQYPNVERRFKRGPPQSLGSPAVTERIEYSGFQAHSLDRRQILHLATVGEFVIAHETYSMRRGSAHPFKRLSGPSTCEHPLGDIGSVLEVRVFHLFQCNKSIEVRTRLRDRLTAGDHGKGTCVECPVDIFAFPGRTARLFGAELKIPTHERFRRK